MSLKCFAFASNNFPSLNSASIRRRESLHLRESHVVPSALLITAASPNETVETDRKGICGDGTAQIYRRIFGMNIPVSPGRVGEERVAFIAKRKNPSLICL